MQQMSPNSTANTSKTPEWYKSYFVAVVESDRDRALFQIERAQRAIRDRVIELRRTHSNNPREMQDLDNASIYLGILLQQIGKTGSLLWD